MMGFEGYLREINKAWQRGDATEHTHRPALKALVEGLGKKVTATNEPKRIQCGAPDYIVSRRTKSLDQTVGYIEAKDIGANLNQIAKSEQIKKRYLPSLNNFILTDYIEFRWYLNGEKQLTAILAEESAGKFKVTSDGEEKVGKLLEVFLSQEPEKIKIARELAEKMAHKAQMMRDIIKETFRTEEETGALHGQFEAFKEVLLHDLTEEQFADMYAQTICYGLFSARCHIDDVNIFGKDKYAAFHGMDDKAKELTREHAAYLLPKTNPFLRKMFSHIAGPDLDDRIVWLVDDLVELLRKADMGVILRDFARQTKRKDPVVHFYETFLKEYDAKLKKSRGVYYTPDEVVSYIVRSVDYLLRTRFGLRKGLADESKIRVPVKRAAKNKKEGQVTEWKEQHRCLILDPAVGTGTFLHEVVEQIHSKIQRQNKGAWSEYVRDHLLPRLFGFELMMAPYAVAHMKLGLQLAETGYDFESDERLGVYLTNTLEEAEETSKNLFVQYLSQEAHAANKVKKELPIMVVTGNPPYSGLSVNMNDWIEQLLKRKLPGKNGAQSYYEVDGKPLGEKKVWLQDDYVKFIRFGQHRIEQTGTGILAFITNHGFLDNPTFRGMRQSLMQTFDEIYLLDLHGNSKKKETCPDGSADKNVFDIQQGVSIGIFVKATDKVPPPSRRHSDGEESRRDAGGTEGQRDGGGTECRPEAGGTEGDTFTKVYHADLYGLRKGKYEWLTKNEIKTTAWTELKPNSPYYFFVKKDESSRKEYENYLQIGDILPVNVTGIVTARDKFVIDFDKDILLERINEFRNLKFSDGEIRSKFFTSKGSAKYLPGDTRSWKIAEERKKVASDKDWDKRIRNMLYRPFDKRNIYYTEWMVDWPRTEVMRHMMAGENLGIVYTRPMSPKYEFSVLPTKSLIDQCTVGNKSAGAGISYITPLYLYPKDEKGDLFEHSEWPVGKDGRVPNLDKGFVEEMAGRVGLEFVSDGVGDLGIAGVPPATGMNAAGTAAVRDGGMAVIKDAAGTAAVRDGGTAVIKDAAGTAAVRESKDAGQRPAVRDGVAVVRGVRWRDRGYLPHWEKEGGIYHVTFRLADSLPKSVAESYALERKNIQLNAKKLNRKLTKHEINRLKQLYSENIEKYLNSGKGKCYLKQKKISELAAGAISHFDNKRYRLYACCIMPNHVHVIFKPLSSNDLGGILHSWKSFIAHEANNILGRKGPFWQKEYYDHLIRDEEEFYETIKYVCDNPMSAGLKDWQWVWVANAGEINEVHNAAGTVAVQGNKDAGQRPAVQNAAGTAAVRGTFGPEDVLGYIYGVFHSPSYRKRYAEFLKIDFPRVPQPSGKGLFVKLSRLGRELMGLHLLESEVLEDEEGWPRFPAEGDMVVEKGYPKYVVDAEKVQEGKVYINAEQYFEGVRPEVWEFHVGGYQVCEKWLKDRRERKLDYEDVCHYQKVVVALGETIRLMGQVDEVIEGSGGWPMGGKPEG